MAVATAGRAGKSMLRIGCVKYLNARPLIRGWQGDVDFDHPSALCNKLAGHKVDVALVSSFEFLRNPIYWIVDDVSISSAGPVYSVVLAHHGDITKIKEIELDPASETSVNLLRCLLVELGLNPRLRSTGCQPAVIGSPPRPDTARLLIGDQAIHFRQEYPNEFHFWDLGERWKELVGIPFVYALWLIRPEIADPKQIAKRLRALRDENLAKLDDLIAELVAGVADPDRQKQLNRGFFLRYYREHLRFSFGKNEKEGLRIFADLCINHGVLPKHDLAFRVV
jgi:chorismate dehydratase